MQQKDISVAIGPGPRYPVGTTDRVTKAHHIFGDPQK